MEPNLSNLKAGCARLTDAQRAIEGTTSSLAPVVAALEEVMDRNPAQHGGHQVRLQYGIAVDPSTLRERACAFVADETNRWRHDAAPLLTEYDRICFARDNAVKERDAASAALQEEVKVLAPIASERAARAADALFKAAVAAILPFFPSAEDAEAAAMEFPRVVALWERYAEGHGTLSTQAKAIVEVLES